MLAGRRLLLAALIGWAAIATLALIVGAPLGHDEAQYTLAARGEVPGGTWLYLSPGTVAIARVGAALGEEPWLLRLPFVLLGVGVPLSIWALGRVAFDDRTGAWAAAVIAGANPFLVHSAELLSDLPAAACVVAGLAVIVRELSRETGPTWWLVAAAPAWAAAFYVRYGHAPVIAIAALVACALWWRRIVARPLPVIATSIAFAILLVPHLWHSLDMTGSMFGIVEHSRSAPAKEYIGEGLVAYLTSNPFRFYGLLVTPVILVGVASIVWRDPLWRVRVLLGAVALGQIFALGLQTRAQPRYVYVAVMLLVVLGVDAIARLAPRFPRVPRVVPYVAVAAAWLLVVSSVVPTLQKRSHGRAHIMAAAETIIRDTAGRPCFVLTLQLPQVAVATPCAPALARPPYPLAWPVDRRIYVVSITDNVADPASLAQLIGGTAVELPVPDPRARVWYVER